MADQKNVDAPKEPQVEVTGKVDSYNREYNQFLVRRERCFVLGFLACRHAKKKPMVAGVWQPLRVPS